MPSSTERGTREKEAGHGKRGGGLGWVVIVGQGRGSGLGWVVIIQHYYRKWKDVLLVYRFHKSLLIIEIA